MNFTPNLISRIAAFALIVIGISPAANATLVKTTADFTVTSIYLNGSNNFSAYNVSDTFQFEAVYDNAGTHMATEVNGSTCLTSHVATPGVICSHYANSVDWDFMDNATFNLGAFFDLAGLASSGGVEVPNRTYTQNSEASSMSHTPNIRFTLTNNSFNFNINSVSSSGFAELHYLDGNGVYGLTGYQYTMSNWKTTSLSVPEPTSFAIFVLGIMGLASRRFIQQS